MRKKKTTSYKSFFQSISTASNLDVLPRGTSTAGVLHRNCIKANASLHAPARRVSVFQALHIGKDLVRASATGVGRTSQEPRGSQSGEA